MSGNLFKGIMEEEYEAIHRDCLSLNTELDKIVPLAKKIHILSSNALSGAIRAGQKGDAFRVLAQEIQLLGVELSACIHDSQKVITDIVMLSSNSTMFSENNGKSVVGKFTKNNKLLSQKLTTLTDLFLTHALVVKKCEYLAMTTSFEAVSAGEHSVNFDVVSSVLRKIISELMMQFSLQQSLLRDLSDAMEKLQYNQKDLLNAYC